MHAFRVGLGLMAAARARFTVTKRMLDMFRRPGDPDEHLGLYAIPAAALVGGCLAGQLAGAAGPQRLCSTLSACCGRAAAPLASWQVWHAPGAHWSHARVGCISLQVPASMPGPGGFQGCS